MKNKNNLKICNNCVMDTTDSSIVFNENGVCDHCIDYYKNIEPIYEKNVSDKSEINKLFKKVKDQGKNSKFDCIIGVSGGIDSSYLCYLMAEFELRPLLLHVDSGWNTQVAVNNVQMLVDKLNYKLHTIVIDWEEMKDLQLSFFKSGVPHLDTPQDHSYFASLYKFAVKYDIKYIFSGGNFSTECIRNPLEWMYYQSDSRQIKHIHKLFGKRPLKNFPFTNILWHKFYLPYFKGIKVIRPLDFFRYNKNEALKLLTEKLGYQAYGNKHHESRFTRFYESYWLPEKFGFDCRKVQYSSLILTKQMIRKDALDLLKSPSFDPQLIQEDLRYISNKLDINVNELEHYFNSKNKTYKDYKNLEWIYKIGSTVLRKLGIERGGKR